jgi:hypothetical protein
MTLAMGLMALATGPDDPSNGILMALAMGRNDPLRSNCLATVVTYTDRKPRDDLQGKFEWRGGFVLSPDITRVSVTCVLLVPMLAELLVLQTTMP